MKRLLEDLEKEIPHVRSSVLAAMGNVRPSHLADRDLFDFAALGAPGEKERDAA
jgi:tRNA 2-thiocytidine biosynthesis protein TtcA